jgi:hypothetical protein
MNRLFAVITFIEVIIKEEEEAITNTKDSIAYNKDFAFNMASSDSCEYTTLGFDTCLFFFA